MFHGESQVFSEGVEEGKVSFCMIFFFLKAPHPSSTKWG